MVRLGTSIGIVAAMLLGGPPGRGDERAAPTSQRYKITVVGAAIAPTRPDGSPWHTEPPDSLLGAITTLGLISYGTPPALAKVAGDTMAGSEKKQPPSPKVRVLFAGEQMETFPVVRKASPVWNYSFAITVSPDRASEPLYIMVVDAEGDEIIGKTKVEVGAFVGKPGFVVEDAGSVQLLQFKVEPAPPSASSTFTFTVAPKDDLDKVAADVDKRPRPGVAGDWRGVPILNGDYVRIRATGTVCPNSGSICAGPEGISPKRKSSWQSYNRKDFKGLYHAALIGMLAGKPVYVGRWLEFKADTAGTLLLGINDNDVGNNSGTGFQVIVEVNPPDMVSAGTVGSCGYLVDHSKLLMGTDALSPEALAKVEPSFAEALRACEAKPPSAQVRKCILDATDQSTMTACQAASPSTK